MHVQPTLLPPVSALLAQVAKLLREGVEGWIRPVPFAEPYWQQWNHPTARTGAPAGHFLLTEGCRMYPDDVRVEVKAPYCIIALGGDPQPMDQRIPSALWQVPVVVELAWKGDDAAADIRTRLAMITGLLCIDYPAVDPQPARPASERLSVADALLVYGNDTITAVKQEPLKTMDGHPVARLSFTVLCSALPPL